MPSEENLWLQALHVHRQQSGESGCGAIVAVMWCGEESWSVELLVQKFSYPREAIYTLTDLRSVFGSMFAG